MTTPCYVLGLSAFYHDSAAALTRDGEIVAAAQEERFSRVKHDRRFPGHAINYCLAEAQIEPDQLSAVVFYDNPIWSLDRILRTCAHAGPNGMDAWMQGAPGWLAVKLHVERLVRDELKHDVKVLFTEHHLSHAASAFYPSPYEEAAILTVDGVGEWATTTIGVGEGSTVKILEEIHFPHSLGLLYSAFTYFTGFKVNSGEYKLMGLAPYGDPIYADKIREHLIDVKDDGSFQLNLDYFGYLDSRVMTNDKFAELFGGPARAAESRISKRETDLAASIQVVTEEVVYKLAEHARELTGKSNVCLAGGVALNCVANGKLLKRGTFDKMWIQPAAGDAGGALGAALSVTHQYFDCPRSPADNVNDRQKGSYLGPRWGKEEIATFLDYYEYPYTVMDDAERATYLAQALADGKIVGYFCGRMEFGPRALGGRSILGDARNETTQSTMNLKIKYRESFRPFAPSVLAERSKDFFDLDAESPYMLLVAPVQESIRTTNDGQGGGEDLIEVVNQKRSSVPAITHVDYSARVQSVDGKSNPHYHELISAFEKITGTGCIVNTSFNVRGEPIVCFPADAYKCFMRTEMDILVLENFILVKGEQPKFDDNENWRDEYELD